VYWSPSDTGSGAIDFDLLYASLAPGEVIGAGSFTDVIPGTSYETVNAGTELEIYSFTATIPAASLAAGDILNLMLARTPGDAGDTYNAENNIHMVEVNYTGIIP
jgi:hypothetical protein